MGPVGPLRVWIIWLDINNAAMDGLVGVGGREIPI